MQHDAPFQTNVSYTVIFTFTGSEKAIFVAKLVGIGPYRLSKYFWRYASSAISEAKKNWSR